ncbi:MAG: LysM peptidoglycan-binding domain-containing protein [bacterium]|nr:LysM peptidoglycan-binding domain-containing protein [bacterium]
MQLRRCCYSSIDIFFFVLLALFLSPLLNGATSHAGTTQAVIPLHPTVNPAIADRAGYITRGTRFLGTIFHTEEKRRSLSNGNQVIIDVGINQQLQIGDQFTIFRSTSTVQHPISEQNIGTLVTPQGAAIAVRVQASTAVLQITKAFTGIEVGDRVQKMASSQHRVSNVELEPADRNIAGVIIASQDGKVSLGEEDIVYIDQGKLEGVRIGDQFKVYQEGDTVQHPISHLPVHLPRRALGELSVLDVRDHTAAAAITYSRHELSVGAPVALHATLRIIETKPKVALDPSDLLAQITPCLQASHTALQAAQAAGATDAELAPAQSALDSAQKRFEQAKAALSQGNTKQARQLLDIAQKDCLSAQELGQQARIVAERRAAQSERYAVQRGDTLWGISAQEAIYNNSLLWPVIYKSNRDQIQDPDLIFPKQIFVIPRNYSPEEAATAIQRARKRRSWQLGDGPDMYILEGIQQ